MHNNKLDIHIHVTNEYFFFQHYRMGNTHIQALDLSTADGVYCQITTGVPQHTSNTLPHTYSSLVNVQQNSRNEKMLPQKCSEINVEENIAYQFPVAHNPLPMHGCLQH